ncbi:hypothetical protein [Desulfopila aestuarii]|uniref:Type IV pilus assembly protein PilX n=1 Tax=Desulfopila aestuarii DSM 18488 TaxID=1121416 RepID=A0A1M7Y1N7_9BACT|nr:hypothetical protein [Desulfopila aestuarii]SHO45725.1 hypothetical protein SAMN02745220_01187 [Desulfopila aestuarii DSM 18488]
MTNRLNESGFALLAVLIIGMISMVLVSTLFFVLLMHTQMSGKDKRYLNELETAKGTSEFIMASLRDASLTCNSGNPCTANDTIDLHGSICNAMGRTMACTGLSATYLSSTLETGVAGNPDVRAVAVRVTSTALNTPERAVVEFVYKVW